jgi:hypothetical protein
MQRISVGLAMSFNWQIVQVFLAGRQRLSDEKTEIAIVSFC